MPLDLSSLTTEQQVSALFIGYFNRAPAVNGFDYYVEDLTTRGLSLEEVAMAFVDQTETEALYPGIMDAADRSPAENRAFVTDVFQNLFGRDPNFDADGNNYWVDQLNSGANAGRLILEIMGGANDADQAVLLNKIQVSEDYVAAAREAGVLTRDSAGDTILDGVTDDAATVTAAQAAIADRFDEDTTPPVTPTNTINLNPDAVTIPGTADNDIFRAESGDLTSSISIDGGAGTDALSVFNETNGGVAISPRTDNIEQFYMTNQANDLTSVADNNVGGYGPDDTVMVDVELDAGRMNGVNRWETFDSRADLVIEDARDDTPQDGTFTAEQTVSMVSTDPGNVDFAVYFDDPVNTANDSGTLTVRLLDLDSAAQGEGPLNDNPYDEVSFTIDGVLQTLSVEALAAANVSYAAYVAALQASADAQGIPVEITLGGNFTLLQADGSPEVGTEILISVDGSEIGEGGFNASAGLPANNNTVTRQLVDNNRVEELISLNVEFDDVGKGSTGGDALFGAMSTGRQAGDDGTSNSIGIQEFDITVDRSSKLQTINSTNNALQQVLIGHGQNSGINNTTNSADDAAGDLSVRGQANPGIETGDFFTTEADAIDASPFGVAVEAFGGGWLPVIGNGSNGIATDSAMPGGVPQHNVYGFSDVQVINAGGMTAAQDDGTIGSVDLTAELTTEIVEKYLDIADDDADGNRDDELFSYTLGSGDDEFFLNIDATALVDAGTGSREDFNMVTSGGAGDDVITINIGESLKRIDEQGEDHYVMATSSGADTANGIPGWYQSSHYADGTDFAVNGGGGADTIWTNGWGDFRISDGGGDDVIYTDNSGVVQSATVLTNLERPIAEHDQIDYVTGAVWIFNAEGPNSGATNDTIILQTGLAAGTTLTTGSATVTVSYSGVGGNALTPADGVYTATATIPVSQLSIAGTNLRTDEQAYNQALKQAINNDPVLSNLFEAIDGAGNSLVVYSKTDGAAAIDNLDIAITQSVVNTAAPVTTAVRPAGYDTAVATDVTFIAAAVDSVAESDNTITMAADGDNDLVVLSTSDMAGTPPTLNGTLNGTTDLNGASNEELNFNEGNFGSDTLVNFDEGDGSTATATNEDVMDFLAIDYVASAATFSNTVGGTAAYLQVDDSISLVTLDTSATGNDTAAKVADQYDGLSTTGTAEAIAIVVNTADDNTGSVYLVTDTATGDATASLQGEISLIGTDWSLLTFDNFA